MALALLGPWCGASRAHALCEDDRSLSVGVTVRSCTETGRRWSVVIADLAAADVAVRVTRPAERGRTVDAWSADVPGAVAVVPGGPFTFPGYVPLGLTIGEGEAWPDARDDGALGVLALDAVGAGLVAPAEVTVPAESWMRTAVSGPIVLRAGSPIATCEGSGCERMPRAAAGLSEDGRELVIVVAEGWAEGADGVTDPEIGGMVRSAGAYDAIRIGEGATSLLRTAGGVGAIASSDGAPRPTAAFLAVVDRGSGASGELVGVVERFTDHAPLPAVRLRVTTTDGTEVAAGGTLTTNAYWRFPLPERTYVVYASLDGYRTQCRVCNVVRGMETWCSMFLENGSGSAECSAPPRGIDAGSYPVIDAGVDAGGPPDAGIAQELGGGCSIALGAGRGPAAGAAIAAALLGLAVRWRSSGPRRRG